MIYDENHTEHTLQVSSDNDVYQKLILCSRFHPWNVSKPSDNDVISGVQKTNVMDIYVGVASPPDSSGLMSHWFPYCPVIRCPPVQGGLSLSPR